MRSVHILASLPTVPTFLASHLLLRSTTGMLFYNSMLSLPMLFGAVIVKGELTHMAEYPLLWHRTFQLVLLASSALGLTINHSTFVCTRINEPLMTSVAGALAQRQCRGCVMPAQCCCIWQGPATRDIVKLASLRTHTLLAPVAPSLAVLHPPHTPLALLQAT
jgi:hypothetical protein